MPPVGDPPPARLARTDNRIVVPRRADDAMLPATTLSGQVVFGGQLSPPPAAEPTYSLNDLFDAGYTPRLAATDIYRAPRGGHTTFILDGSMRRGWARWDASLGALVISPRSLAFLTAEGLTNMSIGLLTPFTLIPQPDVLMAFADGGADPTLCADVDGVWTLVDQLSSAVQLLEAAGAKGDQAAGEGDPVWGKVLAEVMHSPEARAKWLFAARRALAAWVKKAQDDVLARSESEGY